jgi:hypothetical protein
VGDLDAGDPLGIALRGVWEWKRKNGPLWRPRCEVTVGLVAVKDRDLRFLAEFFEQGSSFPWVDEVGYVVRYGGSVHHAPNPEDDFVDFKLCRPDCLDQFNFIGCGFKRALTVGV